MWFFSRKYRLTETELFKGLKDYHSHILPGVDDGIKSIEASLEALAYFEELGITHVTLTPHVMVDVNTNSQAIDTAYAELQEAYKGSISLALASEYMIDSGFERQLSDGSNIRHIGGEHLLVETSYMSAPVQFDELLYKVASNNLTPIVAHPERYNYMPRSKYHSLKDCEYKLQLNLLSFANHYGERAIDNARYLLENQMYDLIGTDLHSTKVVQRGLDNIKLSSKHIDMLLALKERSNALK